MIIQCTSFTTSVFPSGDFIVILVSLVCLCLESSDALFPVVVCFRPLKLIRYTHTHTAHPREPHEPSPPLPSPPLPSPPLPSPPPSKATEVEAALPGHYEHPAGTHATPAQCWPAAACHLLLLCCHGDGVLCSRCVPRMLVGTLMAWQPKHLSLSLLLCSPSLLTSPPPPPPRAVTLAGMASASCMPAQQTPPLSTPLTALSTCTTSTTLTTSYAAMVYMRQSQLRHSAYIVWDTFLCSDSVCSDGGQ